jgi:hypothetical protein
MSGKKSLYRCDCGCGREEYYGRLKTVEIEYALDESLRQIRCGHRYYVTAQCEVPFVQELQAKRLMEGLVERMRKAKWPWWKRLLNVRRIVRIQFVINIRNRGIEMTKRISLRSGILFVASPRVADILWRYWRWNDRHELKWRWKHKATPRA